MLRSVRGGGSLASVSRFLSEAPWEATALATTWRRRFDTQLRPQVARLHAEQRAARTKRRGRPLIVCDTLDGSASEVRFWATSDVRADVTTMIGHLAARWDIEVLFADTKELLGLDHYQVMTTTAIVRCWTLVLAAYVFLDEERARLRHETGQYISIGEAQREVQRVYCAHLITWILQQARAG